MSNMYECVLVVVQDECVSEAIQVGIDLAKRGYVNVYHYRSGVLVATKDEIPEDDDHTQYPLVGIGSEHSSMLYILGIQQEDYPHWYNTFSVVDTVVISR